MRFFPGKKNIKKGENALESNRLQSFVYDCSMGSMKGKVKASMKKVYEVEVSCMILVKSYRYLGLWCREQRILCKNKPKKHSELKIRAVACPTLHAF